MAEVCFELGLIVSSFIANKGDNFVLFVFQGVLVWFGDHRASSSLDQEFDLLFLHVILLRGKVEVESLEDLVPFASFVNRLIDCLDIFKIVGFDLQNAANVLAISHPFRRHNWNASEDG